MERFRIVPDEVPTKLTAKSSLYDAILAQFEESGLDSGRVEVPGGKPATIALALRKKIATRQLDLSVVRRGEDVFLVKGK